MPSGAIQYIKVIQYIAVVVTLVATIQRKNTFLANVPILYHCKHQKKFCFLFSGRIKWGNWPEMIESNLMKSYPNKFFFAYSEVFFTWLNSGCWCHFHLLKVKLTLF